MKQVLTALFNKEFGDIVAVEELSSERAGKQRELPVGINR